MSEAQILAAAKADPDAQPLSAKELRALKPVTAVKRLRWHLGLSQGEFAARYEIPIGTLRDWEQGRYAPDAAARTFLKIIEANPLGVGRTLQKLAAKADA
jgi:putative transcriptional regulator